jgi:hypothetical protein
LFLLSVLFPLDGVAQDAAVSRLISNRHAAHFVARDFQPVQMRQCRAVKPDSVNFPVAQFNYPAFRLVLEFHPNASCVEQRLGFHGHFARLDLAHVRRQPRRQPPEQFDPPYLPAHDFPQMFPAVRVLAVLRQFFDLRRHFVRAEIALGKDLLF